MARIIRLKYNKMKNIRHGDVDIFTITADEVTGTILTHKGSFTLAEGETTGHNHVISVPNIDDMEVRKTEDGGYILTLKTEGTLVHPEHKELVVPKGNYYVGKEREVDHFAGSVERKVID